MQTYSTNEIIFTKTNKETLELHNNAKFKWAGLETE
jgi:hypothetical protein